MKIDPRFNPLLDLLRTIDPNTEPHWIPNRGNWGDSLIREGAESLFRELNIEVNRISEPLGGDTLIYGGGGAYCQFFDHAMHAVARASRLYRRVIVLPSTYERTPFMDEGNIEYVARDERSRLVSLSPLPVVPDLAFLVDASQFDLEPVNQRLVALRTNKDRHWQRPRHLPDENIDISMAGTHNTPSGPLLAFIARYEEVLTDRLHVAIAAALLGRRIIFFPNGYFKNAEAFKAYPDLFRRCEWREWESLQTGEF